MILFTPLTPCSLKKSLTISDAGGYRRNLKLVQIGIVGKVGEWGWGEGEDRGGGGEAGKVKLSIP